MNFTRRQALKGIAAATVASTGLGITGNTIAALPEQLKGDGNSELANIEVHTRLSAATNDVEVVVTNVGDQTARITQMTPSQTNTKRGVFHFSKLMDNGELVLEAGQSVSVPMTPHTVVLDATSNTTRANSLSAALRSSFSVITENASFARVNIASGIRLA